MKKRVLLVFLFLGITFLFFTGREANAQAKDQPIILKGVTAFPKPNLWNDPVPLFVEAVNKQSHGKLKIEWLGGPEVFASFDQIHALKAGTIDMREKAGMKAVKLLPEEALKFTKMAYDTTWEQIIKASPEYGPKLRKLMSKDAVPKGAFPW